MHIAFRPLTEDDLPMLHGWLNEPGVVEWWEGQDVSWPAVQRTYGADTKWREQWIALLHGEPIGWLQCYFAADNPDETENWWDLGVDAHAAGIDYLVADPTARGRGIGAQMIRAFAIDVVLGRHPEWTQVCAGPFTANVASWRALAKAGFMHVGDIEDDEDGPCRLMVLDRATQNESRA